MNVRLLNSNSAFIRDLQPDRIVNVRILKREEGTALIELNGFKTKAAVDAEVPDNFFALVEPGFSENGQKIVKLIVISRLTGSKYFLDKKEYNFLQSIKSILTELNLPPSDDYFEAARIIYKKGLKLDKEILKTVHLALMKHGEEFADLIAGFFKAGVQFNDEFVEFFFNYKKLLKYFLPDSGKTSEKTAADTPGILQELFKLYFGPGSGYYISLIDKENDGEEMPMQWRKEKWGNNIRYYFDFSNDKTGSFIVIADRLETLYKIEVYLDKSFIEVNRQGLAGFSIKEGKNIDLVFRELKNPYLFWMKRHGSDDGQKENKLFNLDISV